VLWKDEWLRSVMFLLDIILFNSAIKTMDRRISKGKAMLEEPFSVANLIIACYPLT
jgi:hypothetical protein